MDYTTYWSRDLILSLALSLLCVALYFVPTGFEAEVDEQAVRCTAEVVKMNNAQVQRHGLVQTGDQGLDLEITSGPKAGQEIRASNNLHVAVEGTHPQLAAGMGSFMGHLGLGGPALHQHHLSGRWSEP